MDQRHIGAHLAARRAELELSLSDVSDVTNIRTDFLQAIETLNTDALPSIGYVLGYVRTYAKAVGLDGTDAVARYKKDVEVPDDLGMRNRPHYVPKTSIRLPRGIIPALGVVGFAVMLFTWYGVNTETVAAPTTDSFGVNEAEIEPSAVVRSDMLTLKATAPSWVQIKDAGGTSLVSRIFVTGETWQAPRNTGYTVSVRDAGAVDIYLGETELPPLGHQGEAIYDAPLDYLLSQ
ncbi:helix-turn-helix domain-containing protein [Litorimonas sp. RW-G-Af-16]|uniref:helix-turn-helix domain-containing protein n=1 Tax=Litorimonas sp. RW-G-Af-16 TaxID=3241168 RepID=UPI00390CD6D4